MLLLHDFIAIAFNHYILGDSTSRLLVDCNGPVLQYQLKTQK